MRTILFVVLTALAGIASGQGGVLYGVRFESQLPIDDDLIAFIDNPLAYAMSEPRSFSATGFIEWGDGWGVEALVRPAEYSLTAYRIMRQLHILNTGGELAAGIRVGVRERKPFARLQVTVQFWGEIVPKEPP